MGIARIVKSLNQLPIQLLMGLKEFALAILKAPQKLDLPPVMMVTQLGPQTENTSLCMRIMMKKKLGLFIL